MTLSMTPTLSLPPLALFGIRYLFFSSSFIDVKNGIFDSIQINVFFFFFFLNLQAGTWEEKNLNKWASDRIKVCAVTVTIFFYFHNFLIDTIGFEPTATGP